MGVSGEIMQQVFRSAEWWFGINDPILPGQPVEKALKLVRLGKAL
jgi:hypothetical protein